MGRHALPPPARRAVGAGTRRLVGAARPVGPIRLTAVARRGGSLRLAGVAGAVAGSILGAAQLLPEPAAQAVIMTPTGTGVLRPIDADTDLPDVPAPGPREPRRPRPVAAVETPEPRAGTAPVSGLGGRGIPGRVLVAYQDAARTMRAERPGCNLTWHLLAGVGRIESGHARGGDVTADGTTRTPIVGPALDGSGNFAHISDSDDGRWDGDTTYDRAVGPMQFLPGTWLGSGRDGNGDGDRNPNNIDDAALGAAGYLCSGGDDLDTRDGLLAAVFRYNRSWDYVSTVLGWAGYYAGGPAVATGPLPGADRQDKGRHRKDDGDGNGARSGGSGKDKDRPRGGAEPEPSPSPSPPAEPDPEPDPPAGETGAVEGKVVDDRGRPIRGARIELSGPADVTVDTAGDGTFAALDLPPGQYSVTVRPVEGYGPDGDRDVDVEAGGAARGMTFTLATSTLSGRVFDDADRDGEQDDDEKGVRGADVRITGTDAHGREVAKTERTGSDGEFAFAGLLAGTYSIEVKGAEATEDVELAAGALRAFELAVLPDD